MEGCTLPHTPLWIKYNILRDVAYARVLARELIYVYERTNERSALILQQEQTLATTINALHLQAIKYGESFAQDRWSRVVRTVMEVSMRRIENNFGDYDKEQRIDALWDIVHQLPEYFVDITDLGSDSIKVAS